MITKSEFIERVKAVPKTIPSKTGKASYTGFRIDGDTLYFHRVVPKTNWNLNLPELYRIYLSNSFINTSVIKKETGGRVNSPSVALLLAIGCIEKNGNRIND
jgi:hypothetical protein